MAKKGNFPRIRLSKHFFGYAVLTVILIVVSGFFLYRHLSYTNTERFLRSELDKVGKQLEKTIQEYEALKKVDQKVRNDELEARIQNIENTYDKAVTLYEELLQIREQTRDTKALDTKLADALHLLSEQNYATAESVLTELEGDIEKKQAEIAASFQIPPSVQVNNSPPSSGYQQQVVETPYGQFLVSVISADLNSAKVVVDTASDGTCTNDCPVDSLGSYAARSGAFAGINGPYFCPAEYPSCADKKNSFDTLLMNKNKVYFNSDNNVYSTVPAVIFSAGSARFVGQSLEWGRDTGVDSVIASQPLLLSGGNVVYGGDDEIKRAGKGTRSFIGASGSTVYIGVVYNANVAEVAQVLKAMGIQNALNLDSGGSTALWSNGRYIVGPGRNTPFGILLVPR